MESPAAHILVVEDDVDCREAVAEYLEMCGYRVSLARDGVEALALLRAAPPPDAILADLRMPRMDGEAFVAEVSRDPRLSPVPVVVMSGAVERRRPPGAFALVAKPFSPGALSDVVADALAWAARPLRAAGS